MTGTGAVLRAAIEGVRQSIGGTIHEKNCPAPKGRVDHVAYEPGPRDQGRIDHDNKLYEAHMYGVHDKQRISCCYLCNRLTMYEDRYRIALTMLINEEYLPHKRADDPKMMMEYGAEPGKFHATRKDLMEYMQEQRSAIKIAAIQRKNWLEQTAWSEKIKDDMRPGAYKEI